MMTTLLVGVQKCQYLVHTGHSRSTGQAIRHPDRDSRSLAGFGGTEVDIKGDAILAIFDAPAQAIRCAEVIQREVETLGLHVRAGVHVGEMDKLDGTISKVAVGMAMQIAPLAGPREVLVSESVRDTVSGSDITFSDRGVGKLEGVAEPRRLFAAKTND